MNRPHADINTSPAGAPEVAAVAPASTPAQARSGVRQLARALGLDTLKFRVAIGALLALALGIGVTLTFMGQVAQDELLAATRQREQVEAARTVAVIGRRVGEMQRALRVASDQFTPALLGSRQALGQHLDQSTLLTSLFASVAVFGLDGQALVYHDADGLRRTDLNIADRNHFRQTVAEARPQVSEPLAGRVMHEPIVAFTQPIKAPDGQVIAVLVGTLRLTSRDLLEDLSETRDDDQDTLIVITDGQGRIIAHPQRALLTRPLSTEPRMAAAFRSWVDDKRPLVHRNGAELFHAEVVAMAGEPLTAWHVWRATSVAVTLAPLQDARRRAQWMAAGLAVVLSVAVMLSIARSLRSLTELEARAAALLRGEAGGSWPEAGGEIGRLGRTLSHLWAGRAQAEALNDEVLRKLRSIMEHAPVGLAFTRHRRYELVSAEICRMLGRDEASLVGQPGEAIFASHDDYRTVGPQVGAAFAEGRPYTGEWRLTRANGDVFWARLMARPVVAGDPSAGTIWAIDDISSQVQDRRRLEHAATHDPLTDVLNREGFVRAVDDALAASDAPATLVALDLDRFKPINDSAGHAAGDAVLKAVAAALQRQVRASDSVGRLGGDEFALLLRGCDAATGARIAEKALRAVEGLQVDWQGRSLSVGASLGVCERSPRLETADQWLGEADAACYAAKHAGRGTVRVATGGGVVIPFLRSVGGA